jgi:hypothetical protein
VVVELEETVAPAGYEVVVARLSDAAEAEEEGWLIASMLVP